jgi:hypothetical protein
MASLCLRMCYLMFCVLIIWWVSYLSVEPSNLSQDRLYRELWEGYFLLVMTDKKSDEVASNGVDTNLDKYLTIYLSRMVLLDEIY